MRPTVLMMTIGHDATAKSLSGKANMKRRHENEIAPVQGRSNSTRCMIVTIGQVRTTTAMRSHLMTTHSTVGEVAYTSDSFLRAIERKMSSTLELALRRNFRLGGCRLRIFRKKNYRFLIANLFIEECDQSSASLGSR